ERSGPIGPCTIANRCRSENYRTIVRPLSGPRSGERAAFDFPDPARFTAHVPSNFRARAFGQRATARNRVDVAKSGQSPSLFENVISASGVRVRAESAQQAAEMAEDAGLQFNSLPADRGAD